MTQNQICKYSMKQDVHCEECKYNTEGECQNSMEGEEHGNSQISNDLCQKQN